MRTERFTLKDAVYLSMGAVFCVLLVLVLVAVNRQRHSSAPEAADPAAPESAVQQSRLPVPGQFSSACASVNRDGRAQQWQTAPDGQLPSDFQPGGTLRQVWSAEPATLMPMVGRDIYAEIVQQEVFEKLVWRDLDPPFEYVPGLAQSWQVSDDGRRVEFTLFPSAVWSDGRPVTSADVIFTLNHVKNPAVAAPIERAMLNDIVESWHAPDAHTVRFTLKRPYFDVVGVCGNRLWILPEHVYSRYTPQQYNTLDDFCIGSGPWKLERWDRGNELIFERNEQYWGPKPALQRIVVQFITSQRQELELFLNGSVDLIGPTSSQWQHYESSDELASVGRGVSYETPLRGYTWIGYNLRLPMFADARTRRALTMLIDRRQLIDTVLGGLGRVVTGPFHPLTEQCDSTIDPLPYDPTGAARLLRDAGWSDSDGDGVLDQDLDGDGEPDPFRFTFLIPSSELGRLVQRYVKSEFATVGIDVRLDEMQWGAYLERAAAGSFEMIMQRSNGGPEIDPHEYWHSSQADGGRNMVGLSDQRVDELIEQARVTVDRSHRVQLWHALHRRLHELQPQTFLWTTPRLVFINNRVQNVQPRSLRLYTSEWYIASDE